MGFFELAVAAPSMKAAADAWGSDPDIFRRGFAEQTEEPKIVEVAMAAPGVVLRRPVGSDGAFKEKAALPKPPKLPKEKPPKQEPAEQKEAKPEQPHETAAKRKSDAYAAAKLRKREADERARQEKAAALEEAERRRALERREREAERARKRREELIAKADAALDKAKAQHEQAMQSLAKRRAGLDEEEVRENAKWNEAQRNHGQVLKGAKG